ncbi:helix-turn-helix domain-containing protein [Streptomyces murinus]|uniref:helix-turn-helix domain-containing protein n=1 Tax=Streptomyces murinus TaxID=33900 RepID=UPI003557B461
MPPAVDPARTALLRAGVDALSVHPDRAPARVREVVGELAVNERQSRNLFADGVGVSPKHYARIDRVRTLITRARTTSWSQLAAATGYYDQSHMTADFRALMGVPPRAYFTDRLPARSPCGARLGRDATMARRTRRTERHTDTLVRSTKAISAPCWSMN